MPRTTTTVEKDLRKDQLHRIRTVTERIFNNLDKLFGRWIEDMYESREGTGIFTNDQWHRSVDIALKGGINLHVIVTASRDD